MKILAVGHEASRTGAPILLASLMRSFRDDHNDSVSILLGGGGPMVADYSAIGPTHTIDVQRQGIFSKLKRALKSESLDQAKRVRYWYHHNNEPELIYINTVAAAGAWEMLQRNVPRSVPVVVHVHELQSIIDQYQSVFDLESLLRRCNVVIAGAGCVKSLLVNELNISHQKIHVVHDWLCRDIVSQDVSSQRQALRKTLGIDASAKICISVGTLDWRKAPETIPMIAGHVCKRNEAIHFLWLGGTNVDHAFDRLCIDAKKLGVAANVHFLSAVEDPTSYYLGADYFALPSREDAYPLVMVEAAAYGLPIVAFANSGGATEFIGDDRGMLVPYLDTIAMGEVILRWARDPSLALKHSNNAKRHAIDNHSREGASGQIRKLIRGVTIR